MTQDQNNNFQDPAQSVPIQDNTETSTQKNDEESSSIWDDILGWVSLLVALPLFLMLARILPDLDWRWNLDRWLLGLLVVAVVYMMMQWVKWLSILGLLFGVGFLTYGSFAKGNHYSWKNAIFDYKSIVYASAEESEPVDYIVNMMSTPERVKIVNACDYSSPKVINFARKCISENEEFCEYADADEYYKYREIIQAFAIFKYVNTNKKWHYVMDPPKREYYAKASASVETLAGDCDCHAIFLASCIRAINVKTRIVITYDHAYPEMGIDKKDWSGVVYLIKRELFPTESAGKKICYHQEGDTYWINLDYTDAYPGGHFMDNNDKKVSIINIP